MIYCWYMGKGYEPDTSERTIQLFKYKNTTWRVDENTTVAWLAASLKIDPSIVRRELKQQDIRLSSQIKHKGHKLDLGLITQLYASGKSKTELAIFFKTTQRRITAALSNLDPEEQGEIAKQHNLKRNRILRVYEGDIQDLEPGVLIKIKCAKHGEVVGRARRRKDNHKIRIYCKQCEHASNIKSRQLLLNTLKKERDNCCEQCGYAQCLKALEFHHLKDKTVQLSQQMSLDKLKEEADNCILLCANCHAEIENEKYKNRSIDIKAPARFRLKVKYDLLVCCGGKCYGCGYDKIARSLQFHHIDPKTKEFGLGNGNTHSRKRAFIEAQKCVLLCGNCHREEHDNPKHLQPSSFNEELFYWRKTNPDLSGLTDSQTKWLSMSRSLDNKRLQ